MTKKTKQLTIPEAIKALLTGREVFGVQQIYPEIPVQKLGTYLLFFEYEDEPEPEEKPVTNEIRKAVERQKEIIQEQTEPKKKGGRPRKDKPLIPEGINADQIIALHQKGMSRERIADICSCTPNDVVTVLREKGIEDVVPAP